MENMSSKSGEDGLNLLINKISKYEMSKDDAEEEVKLFFTTEQDYNHSIILLTLTELQGESLDFLQMFLDGIFEKSIIDGDASKIRFKEFYDFVSTEMVRISTIRQINEKTDLFKKDLESYKDVLNAYENDIKKLNEQIHQKKEQLASINNNHLSILGIFSGIVMVFFGGLSIASETMKFADISIMRLVLIVSLVGFIIFNSIFVLIYLISKLTSSDSDLRVKCNKCTDQIALTCDSCDKNHSANICQDMKPCIPIVKIKNLYPIVYYINLMFISFIAVDFIVWLFIKKLFVLFGIFVVFVFMFMYMFFKNQ